MRKFKSKWTEEHKQFLKDHASGISKAELTRLFNEHFNDELTVEIVAGACKRFKCRSGLDTRFKKGQIPPNKGKHISEELRAILREKGFQKGHIPPNLREQWSERITKDGYVEIKTEAHQKKWKLKHRWIWEQNNGPIPPGYVIRFKDGNKLNCNIDNLYMVTMNENRTINQNGLNTNNPDFAETTVNIAKLIIKQNEVKKKGRNRNGCIQESS